MCSLALSVITHLSAEDGLDAAIVAKVSDAAFLVTARDGSTQVQCSGVRLNQGLILTSSALLTLLRPGAPATISCSNKLGKEFSASVVGISVADGVACLKLAGGSAGKSSTGLTLAPASEVQELLDVQVIGFPLGELMPLPEAALLKPSFSRTMIAGVQRDADGAIERILLSTNLAAGMAGAALVSQNGSILGLACPTPPACRHSQPVQLALTAY